MVNGCCRTPSPYYGSSDDEEDAISFRGAENTAGEPGGSLGGWHLWDINRCAFVP